MTAIDPKKYVTFKRDDLEYELEDAVVIRLKDMFASSALFAYAHTVTTAIEALAMTRPCDETSELICRLSDLRDYMTENALAADELASKVPD